ncbi:MAG: helix-turn-helix transcriptional regulator [Rhodomicrobium sp.]
MTSLQEAPFLTRRARLLSGMTQTQFAEMFGVEDTTVSRWERGKLKPNPKVWKRIREIALRAATPLDAEVIRRSHVYKFIAWMNNLTEPKVVSRGIAIAMMKVGIMPHELTGAWWAAEAHKSPQYPISVFHALEEIQADKGWLQGQIAFAEAHAYSLKLRKWMHIMVAPLPDSSTALIEGAEDTDHNHVGTGYWVRLVRVGDVVLLRRIP